MKLERKLKADCNRVVKINKKMDEREFPYSPFNIC